MGPGLALVWLALLLLPVAVPLVGPGEPASFSSSSRAVGVRAAGVPASKAIRGLGLVKAAAMCLPA